MPLRRRGRGSRDCMLYLRIFAIVRVVFTTRLARHVAARDATRELHGRPVTTNVKPCIKTFHTARSDWPSGDTGVADAGLPGDRRCGRHPPGLVALPPRPTGSGTAIAVRTCSADGTGRYWPLPPRPPAQILSGPAAPPHEATQRVTSGTSPSAVADLPYIPCTTTHTHQAAHVRRLPTAVQRYFRSLPSPSVSRLQSLTSIHVVENIVIVIVLRRGRRASGRACRRVDRPEGSGLRLGRGALVALVVGDEAVPAARAAQGPVSALSVEFVQSNSALWGSALKGFGGQVPKRAVPKRAVPKRW